jgi:hypothetical protein
VHCCLVSFFFPPSFRVRARWFCRRNDAVPEEAVWGTESLAAGLPLPSPMPPAHQRQRCASSTGILLRFFLKKHGSYILL